MSADSISSPIAGPSYVYAVSGVWEKKSHLNMPPPNVTEVAVHVETPPSGATSLPHPISVSPFDRRLHAPLGCPMSLSTHRPLFVSTAPPPYTLHEYNLDGLFVDEEPLTLARMLFVYGFFFFPFWLAGIYILWSPLLPTPDWETGKTESEKVHLLHVLREVELKWARRCLYALLSLLVTTYVLFLVIKYAII